MNPVIEKAVAIGETITESVTEIEEKAAEIIDDDETFDDFDDFDDFDLATKEINPSENPPEYIYTAVESYVNWTQRSVRRFVKMLTRIDAEQLPNSIVDVGGGVGLSTLLLREQLDEAFPGNSIRVVYHNFGNDENSTQLKFAKSVLKNSDRIEYIHGDVPPADAYLFFEFLEHLPSPISWLNELLNRTSPKIICHASSFSHPEHAGHFEFYDCSLLGDGTKIVKGRSASGQVSKFLKKREFQKISHKICWNGLPQFWSNSDVANHFNR